jgi:DNA (cytosine-5)-methyltransferase 1
VFSCDIDPKARSVYEANFADEPLGDITAMKGTDLPGHDLLLAGFPCQAFSICGAGRGFEDARGTLFFDVARILEAKRPSAFVLENVKQLRGHDGGRTLARILETLEGLGYGVDWHVLNALDFGLPQKRERVFIVGFRGGWKGFEWPQSAAPMKPLSQILEKDVPKSYYASGRIRLDRQTKGAGKKKDSGPTIWHENKGGNISVYPYSCAMRAGASHNYLLVDGERRLTEREMLRLQGFPESCTVYWQYTVARRLMGNSLPVPVAEAVISSMTPFLLRRAANAGTKVAGFARIRVKTTPAAGL